MVMAAELSCKRGLIDSADTGRIKNLLARLNLPVRIDFDREAVARALSMDKKRESDVIKFVLLEKIGKAIIVDISLAELQDWIMQW
jgi:3-dehydroquinate synthetase